MKKILAIVAIATTLLLTGCSQVGSAATLGSTKISQATVQSSIDAILAKLNAAPYSFGIVSATPASCGPIVNGCNI